MHHQRSFLLHAVCIFDAPFDADILKQRLRAKDKADKVKNFVRVEIVLG